MGQICSGLKSEANKGSALETVGPDDLIDEGFADSQHLSNDQLQKQQQLQQDDPLNISRRDSEEVERQKKLREEQATLDMIVAMAGRGMVAVRSTRGSTGYYDQGFAAALAAHLEQTTQFPESLPVKLPQFTHEDSLYSILNQPMTVHLPNKVAEDPNGYMDSIAEPLLETVLPAKQQLFARAHPIVETLM
ncbi:unnamed protein product [Cylindrotheca closterium]|uniref:Uncharacterized protein n=1 Tax=Cylindrotheca closterium TaxID=2856 RepID=A0AAD2G7A1_9STRA|nr:unnamed protein product [Cylindrotheca closterium]